MAAKAGKRRPVAKTHTQQPRKKQSVTTRSKAIVPVEQIAAHERSIPSVLTLTRRSVRIVWRNKKLWMVIFGLYIILHIVLVQGLNGATNVASLRNQFADKLSGSVAAYLQLVSGSGISNQAGQGYQTAILIVFSLAIIWALRQLHEQAAIRARDAFYKGMYPLVPALLVLLVMGFQVIPMLVGLGVYQVVLTSGIAGSGLEQIIWGLGALGLTLLTAYLLVGSLMALYIVTLPDMVPREALRSAKRLVQGRRWTVLRKMLFLPVVLLVISSVILLPVIFAVPALAPWLLVLLGALTLIYSHSYLYTLYRGLLHE